MTAGRGPTAGPTPARGGICAVVLAAGEGRRLRPLTEHLPKALCPVGNVALLDRALDRLRGLGFAGPATVAVNACYLGDQVVRHVGARAWLSVEPGDPLGTSGGLAHLRDWIDGRDVLVGNADAYLSDPALPPGPDIAALLAGWDGRTVRLLGRPAQDPAEPDTFGGHRFAGFSLLPWARVRDLPVEVSELVRTVWRPAEAAGELEVVDYRGTFLDTGTPGDYLAANLHAAGGGSLVHRTATVTGRYERAVIGAGALVRGSVGRVVVWPGGVVEAEERLTDAVRVGRTLTVAAAN
ncbi:nucleotidyltransferase family protein [Plantactinospora sp. CA-290183]|uniref:nucleotidyltransferase family protein n=1 Tax=Plantactinospora sp. CA-290183 TaxID=3240006 RepID=UPI003D94A53C